MAWAVTSLSRTASYPPSLRLESPRRSCVGRTWRARPCAFGTVADLLSPENDRPSNGHRQFSDCGVSRAGLQRETNYAKFLTTPLIQLASSTPLIIGGAQDVGARLRIFMPKHAAPNLSLESPRNVTSSLGRLGNWTKLQYWASCAKAEPASSRVTSR
jgi:hypothetical protein